MTDVGRVYGGRSESERRADRRARLLSAGFDLFGTDGWAGATIERLCATAGVATRSFYEEFTSRELLLLAVYESIMADVVDDLVPRLGALTGNRHEQVRVGLEGYFDYLTSDPRRARIVHHEIRVTGSLEPQRRAMTARFADLIAAHAGLQGPAGRAMGLALSGAVSEVLSDWVMHEDPRPDTGMLVDVLVELYSVAMSAR